MHLIVCIDDRDGLSFAGRRLSRDRVLTRRILDLSSGKELWVAPYSATLFEPDTVCMDPQFPKKAGEGDYCFVEKEIHMIQRAQLESVTVFRWNRSYPATEKFPRSLLTGMRLVYTEDFPGNSHDKITMERYCL